MFLSEWREFPSAPCLAGRKKMMTARVSMLLKSRASLTCFRARFLPGRANDLSAPEYIRLSVCRKIILQRWKAAKQVLTVIHRRTRGITWSEHGVLDRTALWETEGYVNADGYGLLPRNTVYKLLCTLNIDTVLVQLMMPAYATVEWVTVSGREIPPPPAHEGKSAPVHAMMALGGGAVDFYLFLNSTLDGGDWPASHSWRLRNNCVTVWIER